MAVVSGKPADERRRLFGDDPRRAEREIRPQPVKKLCARVRRRSLKQRKHEIGETAVYGVALAAPHAASR